MKFLTNNAVFLYGINFRVMLFLTILPAILLLMSIGFVFLAISQIHMGLNPADSHVWTLLYTLLIEFGQVFALGAFSTVLINYRQHTESEGLFRFLIVVKLGIACLLALDTYGTLDPIISVGIFLIQAIIFGIVGLRIRKRFKTTGLKLNGYEKWLRTIYLLRAIFAFTIIFSVFLPVLQALESLISFLVMRDIGKEFNI